MVAPGRDPARLRAATRSAPRSACGCSATALRRDGRGRVASARSWPVTWPSPACSWACHWRCSSSALSPAPTADTAWATTPPWSAARPPRRSSCRRSMRSRNSLAFALVATAITLPLGVLAASVIAYRRGWLARGFDALLMLPLGTSAVIIGFGFLVSLDNLPVDLRVSPLLIPIAHALVALPLLVRATVPVMRSIDDRLREAAAVLGASPLRAWREVDLPIIGRAAAGRCRLRLRGVAGRVRGDAVHRPAGHADDADRDLPPAQPAGPAGLRPGDGHGRAVDGRDRDRGRPLRPAARCHAWPACDARDRAGDGSLWADPWPSTASSLTSRPANGWPCSGPAARASRRCCARLPGSSRSAPGASCWAGADMAGVPAARAQFRADVPGLRALSRIATSRGNVAFGLRMRRHPGRGRRATSCRGARAGRPARLRAPGRRPSFRAASSSAWHSPAPWHPRRVCSCSTSRSARWIASLRTRLLDELRQLFERLSLPIIYVTHDQEEALAIGDRVAVMRDGELELSGHSGGPVACAAKRVRGAFSGLRQHLLGTRG